MHQKTEAEVVGTNLSDEAIRISGLADSLCLLAVETVSTGDFDEAQNLAWSYECLATLAKALANRLSGVSP